MRVIIVGAGQVGTDIAANLAGRHQVVVIDIDSEIVDRLTYSLDVLAIEGDGSSLDTLREAGIEDADMLIACTDDDETNLVTSTTADTVGDAFTIARVRNTKFLETWENARGAFGVDFMVATNLLTATSIIRVIGLPAALDVDPFAGGAVQMAEFIVTPDSSIAGQTVEEADRWGALTFAALVRDGDVTIPRGGSTIEVDDKVIVIGHPRSIQSFAASVAPEETPERVKEIVIIGGSNIGYQTAKLLEGSGYQPKLVERDPERARELAKRLPETVVVQCDGTDMGLLIEEEHVDQADVVITALDSDEKNLLVALLAKTVGVDRAIAVAENGEYTDLFERAGVDVPINPRQVTAEEILRHTQEGQVKNLSIIEERQADVLEMEVDAESVLANRSIQDTIEDLPEGVVIGAITRRGEYIVPRGDTVIEPGDHVVLFADVEIVDQVTSIV